MSAKPEPQAIEVEVLEIDGRVPMAVPEATAESRPPWRHWKGRMMQSGGWWWPVWLLIAIIPMVLVLTVGAVLGVLFVIFALIRGFLRVLFGSMVRLY